MNKHQLSDARRGVRLLTGYLRGTGERLDDYLEKEDVQACAACADPLVTVAVILVRQVRSLTDQSTQTAFDACLDELDPELRETCELMQPVVSALVSGRLPGQCAVSTIEAAIGAQGIAAAAASILGKNDGCHPNAVVARLRKKLDDQDESIQLADKFELEKAATEYAQDNDMIQCRNETAIFVCNGVQAVAADIYNQSLTKGVDTELRDILTGIALVSATVVALAAGTMTLTNEHLNVYPANTLLRQLVEAEFLLWKFSTDLDAAAAWLKSTRDDRQARWKPSNIYRDQDNGYRQKDYSGHCEMGGHPTPIGARLATLGTDVPPRVVANVIVHLLIHMRDCWRHLDKTVRELASTAPHLEFRNWKELRTQLPEKLATWAETDLYHTTTWYFSDPID